MDQVADSTARWMGILSTGLLLGRDAEESALRAQKVLGSERLVALRDWFDAQSPEALVDAKRAVVEACIAIVHADRQVADAERELIERIVQMAELDLETQASLVASVDTAPALDAVIPRIPHPALRELVLVMAWQIANADGKVEQAEHGAYGVLADQLGIAPTRANELRTMLREI